MKQLQYFRGSGSIHAHLQSPMPGTWICCAYNAKEVSSFNSSFPVHIVYGELKKDDIFMDMFKEEWTYGEYASFISRAYIFGRGFTSFEALNDMLNKSFMNVLMMKKVI